MKPNSFSSLLFLVALSLCTAASAQNAGFRRTVVQKGDVSVPNREAVVARVEVDPGVTSGRHTHPGDEISYVLEGEGELLIDGEAPRKIKTGDAFIIPAGKVHEAKSTGSVTMKLVGTYVVEKGQPMATPAAAK
ncbi:cupin domain-containing protein [Undibacterium terreum]|uniref:Cupin n=1 Tax=Undibacterium terreum TaxID=1224302 RepID=A0A916XPZ3_9BURK|nr:cupin domain-containing protein [Undibacterium terreum]GGC94462.1 cupin [Undibacterium terreum]